MFSISHIWTPNSWKKLNHTWFVRKDDILQIQSLCSDDVEQGIEVNVRTHGIDVGSIRVGSHISMMITDEDSKRRLMHFKDGTDDPIYELIDELRYHPNIGWNVKEASDRFEKNKKRKT